MLSSIPGPRSPSPPKVWIAIVWLSIALGIHALHIRVVVAALVGVVAVAHRVAAGSATQQQASARADRGTGAGLSARGADRRTGRGTEQRTADHRVGCGRVGNGLPGHSARISQRRLRELLARKVVGLERIETLARSG
jgi:hypothetical protein